MTDFRVGDVVECIADDYGWPDIERGRNVDVDVGDVGVVDKMNHADSDNLMNVTFPRHGALCGLAISAFRLLRRPAR